MLPSFAPQAEAPAATPAFSARPVTVQKAIEASRREWEALGLMLPAVPEADGAAAAHGHFARGTAAWSVCDNYERVLQDVCNPSRTTNIDGKPLTQTDLERVPEHLALYASQLMREMVARLIGRKQGIETVHEHLERGNEDQIVAWAKASHYLMCRLHSNVAEKPGRVPDMDPAAAMAMRAVLAELANEAVAAACGK